MPLEREDIPQPAVAYALQRPFATRLRAECQSLQLVCGNGAIEKKLGAAEDNFEPASVLNSLEPPTSFQGP